VINLDTNQGRRDDTNQNRSRHRKFFFLSFAKEPYKRDYILQEIPMTLRYGSLQIKKDHGTVITIYVETDRYGSHSSRQKGKRFFYGSLSSRPKKEWASFIGRFPHGKNEWVSFLGLFRHGRKEYVSIMGLFHHGK